MKKVIDGIRNVLKDILDQAWTLLGMAVAWLVLEGSARDVTGNLILITLAIWILTYRVRNPKEQYNNIMKVKPLISILIVAATLSLSGCGWSGYYRYPCQDPVNWNAEECKPPICTANGWCSPDLLGFDPNAPVETTAPTDTTDTTVVDPTTVETGDQTNG